MGSMQHTFGVRELIRAGLQDLDKARELLQELQDNGVSDDRLQSLMATLEHSCDPDVALRNLIDIINLEIVIHTGRESRLSSVFKR